MCFTNVNEAGIRYRYLCIQLTNVQISINISHFKKKRKKAADAKEIDSRNLGCQCSGINKRTITPVNFKPAG